MKHFLVVFKEADPSQKVATAFESLVFSSYPGAAGESDAGIYILSAELEAFEVRDFLTPEDLSLADVFLVVEIGASAALGMAGSDFVNELAVMTDLAR